MHGRGEFRTTHSLQEQPAYKYMEQAQVCLERCKTRWKDRQEGERVCVCVCVLVEEEGGKVGVFLSRPVFRPSPPPPQTHTRLWNTYITPHLQVTAGVQASK